MNLLSLILIFLAFAIGGSIAFVAWELTSNRYMPTGSGSKAKIEEPGDPKEPKESPGSEESP